MSLGEGILRSLLYLTKCLWIKVKAAKMLVEPHPVLYCFCFLLPEILLSRGGKTIGAYDRKIQIFLLSGSYYDRYLSQIKRSGAGYC
jgi:hypothetical protein